MTAQTGHPLTLQVVLIVGHDLSADVGIVLRTFLQHLAIDGIDGIVFQLGHQGILLEYRTVNQRVITATEDTLLHTDADDGVAVEGLTQGLSPAAERQFLDAVLHGLDIARSLHVVGDALEAGLRPVVLLLMILEILGQSGLVLGGLVPDVLIADFIEQQSFVVLTDEVLHLRVLGRQLVGLLVHNLRSRQLAFRLADQRVHLLLGQTVADVALLHELQDALFMELKGFQHLMFLAQDDVVAVGRLHDARHLAVLQGEGRVLELLDQLSALHEGQQSTLGGRARVLTDLLGQFGEVGTLF